MSLKKSKQSFYQSWIVDGLFTPFTYVAARYLKYVSRLGYKRIPVTEKIFMRVGMLPVADHFYQPLTNPKKHLLNSLRKDRDLPGIDWNVDFQLGFLRNFNYNHELTSIPMSQPDSGREYYYANSKFASGDSEYYYNLIRYCKPSKIIEIGSGMSTLMAINAVRRNEAENSSYKCEIICIEPYQNFWLETLKVRMIRKRVEELTVDFFLQLSANDILFIDSSHIIRPQGDVLFEYLGILPTLNSGVFVHVHDIFSPKDYLDEWVFVDHKLWNEQYLLEAFLTCNKEFEIVGALNYLMHNFQTELLERSPVLKQQLNREPGSFWFRKI